MNKQSFDVLKIIVKAGYSNQRIIAEETGYSLGVVNKAIKELLENDYLNSDMCITNKAKTCIKNCKPNNAIILAAGFGMRMVPINMETPKGLLEIRGEVLIERTIRQLHEAGIEDISIVVGFMKERYEYLVDEYNVKLIVNTEYSTKNNLYSVNLIKDKINNSYIIPCDIWCKNNPYSKYEPYSWYMVSDEVTEFSDVRVNRKFELVSVDDDEKGNAMLGISYITSSDSDRLRERITDMCKNDKNINKFWEEALYKNGSMIVSAKVVNSLDAVEINTYEQLRELDSDSNHLKTEAINIIKDVLNVDYEDIKNISVLKKGMTNRSFFFECLGKKYIMRIPGEGTEQLINRKEEADVYKTIKGRGICDNILYINPETGYKITEYIEGARVCDQLNPKDVKKCMKKLKDFHALNLKVGHRFDIFGLIEFYESLWNGIPSIYKDYEKTKQYVFSLKEYIEKNKKEEIITHIDANHDNFLIYNDDEGNEEIRLIDWEYAGMQDPDVDIAMFCIYAMYDREQIDETISLYYVDGCDETTRIKIYCYVAACGLLWSNWCEYKRQLGIDFGEYSIRQYRYGKEFYKIVQEELAKIGEK